MGISQTAWGIKSGFRVKEKQSIYTQRERELGVSLLFTNMIIMLVIIILIIVITIVVVLTFVIITSIIAHFG